MALQRKAGISLLALGFFAFTACGGGNSNVARDGCEVKAGVGRCVERHGKWVAIGSISGTTTTMSPTTTATTAMAVPTSTTSPPSAAIAPSPPPAAAPAPTSPPTLTATGKFNVFWLFSPEMIASGSATQNDCGPMATSYQIQVRDGAGAIITLASLDSGRFSWETSNGFKTVKCDFMYSATMPMLPVYTFVLLEGGNNANQRDSGTASADSILQQGGPPLHTSEDYCPECHG
jgi:hypothetical protein